MTYKIEEKKKSEAIEIRCKRWMVRITDSNILLDGKQKTITRLVVVENIYGEKRNLIEMFKIH